MRKRDVARIERAVEISARNVQIRMRYRELYAVRQNQLQALLELEEETGFSQTHLRRILYTRD
ncbi:MAG: hypothetical protein RhofKO_25810 [Rhodothermales bacterium]